MFSGCGNNEDDVDLEPDVTNQTTDEGITNDGVTDNLDEDIDDGIDNVKDGIDDVEDDLDDNTISPGSVTDKVAE